MAQKFTSYQTFWSSLFTLENLNTADETWGSFAYSYACCIEFSIGLEQRIGVSHAQHYEMRVVATGLWEHLLREPSCIQGEHIEPPMRVKSAAVLVVVFFLCCGLNGLPFLPV